MTSSDHDADSAAPSLESRLTVTEPARMTLPQGALPPRQTGRWLALAALVGSVASCLLFWGTGGFREGARGASSGHRANDQALEARESAVDPRTEASASSGSDADHQNPGPSPFDGATRYVLLGGGGAPSNTQVSLEEHLMRVAGLLDRMKVPTSARKVFFAAGKSDEPVVQVLDESMEISELQQTLAWIFDETRELQVSLRKTRMTALDGASTRENLQRSLSLPASASTDPTAPRRTLLYFAGHGYPADDAGSVSLGLWEDVQVSAVEYEALLAKLPSTHQVVSVLAQCHSGGFGALLYPKGDISRPATNADRCAFFAVPPDYLAAGCTPEADRSDPDDYSTWFFSALEGQRHDGRPLPGPTDFNRDGRVSLEEAHAFARIHDGTIDIPVSTRDYFLRVETRNLPLYDGLTLASPWQRLLEHARPAEKAVMEVLTQRLALQGDDIGLRARYQADRLSGELARLDEASIPLRDGLETQRVRLKRRLLNRWPWLKTPFGAKGELSRPSQGPEIWTYLQSTPEFQEYVRLTEALNTQQAPVEKLELQFAQFERLARVAETVVMEAWVKALGSEAQKKRLAEITACEAGFL